MKFTIDKDEIVKAINYADSVISPKTTHNILQNVLLEAANDKINISATDLEVGFITSLPATIEQDGDITVVAKKLLEIIKRVPPCNLIFELLENNNIKIYSKDKGINSVINIHGIPRIDFPEIRKPVEEKYFEFPQKDFKNMIKRTLYAVSHEETRYYLNGTYLEKEGEYIKMVSTDSRRLAYIHKNYPINEPDFGLIIPIKILNQLLKVLGDQGNLKIAIGEKQIFFEIGDMYFVSNLLDGNFPDYKKVIPETHDIRLNLNTQEVLSIVERVSPMSDFRQQIVLKLASGELTVYAINPDLGKVEDKIQIEYDGPEIQIGFNFRYLADALREIETDNFVFDIISPNNPTVIRGENDEDYVAITMPMKITS